MSIVSAWWHENRLGAPTLFDDELVALIERLKNRPTLGTEYETISGLVVWRTLLPKSAQHV